MSHDQGPAYNDCAECGGDGTLGGYHPEDSADTTTKCQRCNGDGFVEREKDEMAEEIDRLRMGAECYEADLASGVEYVEGLEAKIETLKGRLKAELRLSDALDLLARAEAQRDAALHAFKVRSEYCDRVKAQRDGLKEAVRTIAVDTGASSQAQAESMRDIARAAIEAAS